MKGKKKLLVFITAVMMFGSALSVQADGEIVIYEQISDECRSPLCYDSKNLEKYHRYLGRELTGQEVILKVPTGECCR